MAEWVKDLALSLLWLGSLLWCGFDLGTFMCRGTAPPYTHTHTQKEFSHKGRPSHQSRINVAAYRHEPFFWLAGSFSGSEDL